MRIALSAAREGGLWADGPLVHNDQAIDLMVLHGVNMASTPGEGDSQVLVRAHGAPPERRREWEKAGLRLVDATCVHVARNQRLAARAAADGRTVLLAGDADHAEVRAVAASAGPDCRVVSTPGDVERLDGDGPFLLLAQTTFNVDTFQKMAAVAQRRLSDCRVVDTVCRATHDRQREVARIAGLADALVVVGGRRSANTRRLADTGRALGKPVFQVETAAELRDADFADFRSVAVTSGASTPGWITQEVVNRLRFMGRITPLVLALRLVYILAQSRLLTAISAAGLALGAQFYLAGELLPGLAGAGAGFIFFAHILNRRVPADPEARRLSLADGFYEARRSPLLIGAWLGAGLALYLAAAVGAGTFALFACAVGGTALYASLAHRRSFRDSLVWRYGGSASPRNWAMAVGWALVLAGPPALAGGAFLPGLGATAFIFLICFGGTLIRDLHDTVSDRLMGIDTLPSRLGPPLAKRLADLSLRLAASLPLLAAAAAIVAGGAEAVWFVFLLLVPAAPGLGLYLLDSPDRARVRDAVLLQAGVDAMGALVGLLAVAFGVWA